MNRYSRAIVPDRGVPPLPIHKLGTSKYVLAADLETWIEQLPTE